MSRPLLDAIDAESWAKRCIEHARTDPLGRSAEFWAEWLGLSGEHLKRVVKAIEDAE